MDGYRALGFAVFVVALCLAPLAADANKVRIVSGIIGAQDEKSKALLALSPAGADQVGRRDLLSTLQLAGQFTVDKSRNVDGMTFVTRPYQTQYRYVCREDRVTLRYQTEFGSNASGL